MSNVRTISQEDLDHYPSLKGREVGDVISAEEDAKLRASDDAVQADLDARVEADAEANVEAPGNEGEPKPKKKK